jgi:hypothetical protein
MLPRKTSETFVFSRMLGRAGIEGGQSGRECDHGNRHLVKHLHFTNNGCLGIGGTSVVGLALGSHFEFSGACEEAQC